MQLVSYRFRFGRVDICLNLSRIKRVVSLKSNGGLDKKGIDRGVIEKARQVVVGDGPGLYSCVSLQRVVQ